MTEEEKDTHNFFLFFFFTNYFDDIFTKTALFTVLITTVVSFYLLYGSPNRPFLCATSLASATSSYYYLRNSHVYRHYSLSSYDSQPLTLLSLLLLHAALSLLSPAPVVVVKGVRRAFYRCLCSAMEATGFLFYLGSQGLVDDVAAAATLYTFSLFVVCFMKALAPDMRHYNILSIPAYSMLVRVSRIFSLWLIFLPLFYHFIAFHLAGFLQVGRALLLG